MSQSSVKISFSNVTFNGSSSINIFDGNGFRSHELNPRLNRQGSPGANTRSRPKDGADRNAKASTNEKATENEPEGASDGVSNTSSSSSSSKEMVTFIRPHPPQTYSPATMQDKSKDTSEEKPEEVQDGQDRPSATFTSTQRRTVIQGPFRVTAEASITGMSAEHLKQMEDMIETVDQRTSAVAEAARQKSTRKHRYRCEWI
ncbi:hypothetical protein CPB83DRAFT_851197 [Crepidotus variabilis]|uniref:Uncharacterized protein n=1 Tax=Crepidotus variabilis TaxID=179855 RepID=A0A9P6EJH3_9AGAR|nr:hypothetical protein CPB83DRAFT_851197 [Crepidotus variabilis]